MKVWVRAKWPLPGGKKRSLDVPGIVPDREPAIEVYDHSRYFCVTGERLAGLPEEPQERQAIVDEICRMYFPEETRAEPGPQTASSPLNVIERARRYIRLIPGAISGQGGHDDTFHVACILVIEFALAEQEALVLLSEYNQRCQPKWSEKELRHKITSAGRKPGPRGRLRDARESDWKSIEVPCYAEPAREETAKPPSVTTLQASAEGYLEKITSSKESLISTGIVTLDYAIGGGVERDEMVIIAARPSHGKSAFALQALDAAAYCEIPCAIVSEEMSALALGKRTVQYVTEVREPLWTSEMERVRSDLKAHFSRRAPCYVIERSGSTERAVDAVKKLADEKGVKVVAVDYAQLLGSAGKSRYESITRTSIELRKLASSCGITLFVLCQLSRAIESRDKFIPRLDDLKDSGQLEQDADVILVLVWPYRLDTHKNPATYEVWIGKNRNRPILAPEVDCNFDPSRQTIRAGAITSGNVVYAPKWNAYVD